jgi:glycosyltransferase involved in cell wall biosynthesis
MTIASRTPEFAGIRPVHPFGLASVEIVVPCYNEEERLDAEAFIAALDQNAHINFVFVNDGSADGTLAALTSLQAMNPERITVLSLEKNSGKAEAVRQGLLYASSVGATFIGYWDADLATPLDAIPDFISIMDKFADVEVVFGSRRALLGHRINRTLKRRAVSRLCGTLARQAIRLPVADTQCGAKLLRTGPALSRALREPFTAGWLFDVELFTRLSTFMTDRSRAFYEQPLAEWEEVAGSKITTTAILKSGLQMLRLIANSRLGLETRSSIVSAPSVRVMPRADANVVRLVA